MSNDIFQIKFKLNNLVAKFKLFIRAEDSRIGIIYTLYSDKFNLIELGFAKNNKILKDRIKKSEFILLDKRNGKFLDLLLLKKTLEKLDVNIFQNNYCTYSEKTLRHLKTLGWPIGNSLYKKRIIRKKISYALT